LVPSRHPAQPAFFGAAAGGGGAGAEHPSFEQTPPSGQSAFDWQPAGSALAFASLSPPSLAAAAASRSAASLAICFLVHAVGGSSPGRCGNLPVKTAFTFTLFGLARDPLPATGLSYLLSAVVKYVTSPSCADASQGRCPP